MSTVVCVVYVCMQVHMNGCTPYFLRYILSLYLELTNLVRAANQ